VKIGYLSQGERGASDVILGQVAIALEARAIRSVGVVQTNIEIASGGLCDMDVRVLQNGPVIRISKSLGQDTKACRLDPEALEHAVVLVQKTMPSAQVLLLNKFGKHESLGRGFRPLIAQALEQNMVVILGVNPKNLSDFLTFGQGFVKELPVGVEEICNWCQTQIKAKNDC
jgi:hypothetical protein